MRRGLVVVEPDGRHVVSAGRVPVQTGDDVARVFVGEDGYVAGRNRRRGRASGDDGDDVIACAHGGVGGQLSRHDAALRMAGKLDGLLGRDTGRVHGFHDRVELIRGHSRHALQVSGHVLRARLPDGKRLGASDVDGPRASRRAILPHGHVFLNGDLSVIGIASVHVDDVLDGVGAGGNTLVVGVGCRVGHGRERGLGACVKGAGRDTGGCLVVMDTSIPVRSPHGDPVADSVAEAEVNEPQVRKEGRGERGHPGRGLRGRRVQILADSQPGQ